MSATFSVFLCSTYSDLIEERKCAIDAIESLKFRHRAMEFFGAHSEAPIDVCLNYVRSSDVMIVIVGQRYGSIEPELGISFTQAEYEEGYKLGKTCLVYFRHDESPILIKHVERTSERVGLLEEWRNKLNSRHTIFHFKDAAGLRDQMLVDLERTRNSLGLDSLFRSEGWTPDDGPAPARAIMSNAYASWKKTGKLISTSRIFFLASERAEIAPFEAELVFSSILSALRPKMRELCRIADETQGLEEENMSEPIVAEVAPVIVWASECGLGDVIEGIYECLFSDEYYHAQISSHIKSHIRSLKSNDVGSP